MSGPSGAGKSTLSSKVLGEVEGMGFSVSYTTRKPRAGERDGVEYRFVDDAAFDAMVGNNEFLEHAGVHGKRYGTAKKDLEAILDGGKDVLLDIDVQGAEQLSKKYRKGVYIFITPPSIEECAKRLSGRGVMDKAEFDKRVAAAEEEIKMSSSYDYIIVNDDIEKAFEKLKAIIMAERTKRDG